MAQALPVGLFGVPVLKAAGDSLTTAGTTCTAPVKVFTCTCSCGPVGAGPSACTVIGEAMTALPVAGALALVVAVPVTVVTPAWPDVRFWPCTPSKIKVRLSAAQHIGVL